MARSTRFPVDAFERGRLPEVCILSGEPTDDHMNMTVRNQPQVGWLILIGLIPYLVVNAVLTKSTSGSLPMTEEVYRGVKESRRAGVPMYLAGFAAGVLGTLLLLVDLPTIGVALFVIGVVMILVGAVVTARANPLRGLQLDKTGRWIEFPNAADHFAETVAALMKTGAL